MKLLKFVLLFALMSIFVMSCEETTTTDDPTPPSYGTLSGVVLDGNGNPLGGATVTFRDFTATTSEQGWFALNSLTVLNNSSFETAVITKDGYSSNVKRVRIFEFNTTHVTNIVLQYNQIATFDNSVGTTVNLNPSNTSLGVVTIEGNTFVNEDGSAYTGEVTITGNGSLPSDDNFFELFPGDFLGTRTDGSEVSLISIGFMQLSATSENKTSLKIADGKTVNLQLENSSANIGDTIPMWHLDEETGVWVEEGAAVVNNAGLFETEVAHFSNWNWDYPVDDICFLTGRVFDPSGDPVENAVVYGEGTDVAYYDAAYTDENGSYTLRALPNSTITIAASTGTYSSDVITFYVDANCNNNVVDDITVHAPVFAVTLTWGEEPSDLDSHLLIPDANDPTQEGYHIAYYDMGSILQYPNAMLDTDDTSSFGPEIITAFNLFEGTYSYYVHNYSGYPNLNVSQGVVTLITSASNRVFTAPSNNSNEYYYWHVFDLVVSATGNTTIVSVNQYVPDISGAKSFELPLKK